MTGTDDGRLTYDERRARAAGIRARWSELADALADLEPLAGWVLESTDDDRESRTVGNPSGERLYCSYNEYNHRVSFSGDLGERSDGRGWMRRDLYDDTLPEDTRPTMSADKTPAEWAKDISRRLLPGYRVLRTVIAGHNSTDTAERMKADEYARRFAALTPHFRLRGRERQSRGESERLMHISVARGEDHITGDVRIAGSYVRFDQVSVPHDVAEAIFKAIAGAIIPGATDGE